MFDKKKPLQKQQTSGAMALPLTPEEARALHEEERKRKEEHEEDHRQRREVAGEQLLEAASKGQVAAILSLCHNPRFTDLVNYSNYEGFTPLHKAAMYATTTLVPFLHALSSSRSFAFSRLGDRWDRILAVTALLDEGANINIKEGRGRTALICAAANGNSDTVQALVARGATTLSMQAKNGWPAAHFAAANGHYETFKLLAEYDEVAKVCAVTGPDGLGPLQLARTGLEPLVGSDGQPTSHDIDSLNMIAGYKRVIEMLEKVVPDTSSFKNKSWVRRGSMRRPSTAIQMAENVSTYARRFSAWGVHRSGQRFSLSPTSPQQTDASASTGEFMRGANTPSPVAQNQPGHSGHELQAIDHS